MQRHATLFALTAVGANKVIEYHATGHYFFLEHREQEQTVAAIREFATQLEADARKN